MGSCLGGLVHETNAPCITTARMEIHHDWQQCQEAVALDHPCCHHAEAVLLLIQQHEAHIEQLHQSWLLARPLPGCLLSLKVK